MAGVFGELDSLLGLGSDRHREHGKALAADLTRTLQGAMQCREAASSLLAVDDSLGEGLHTDHKGKPNGHHLFAALDGMPAAAAPRLNPFKKEMEALMTKVANESTALSSKHQVEVAEDEYESAFDDSGEQEFGSEAEEPEEEVPAFQITAECTEPIFAELEELLNEVPDHNHDSERKALEATLARAVSSLLENKEQAASVTEQLLQGEDAEDPLNTAWRRYALESLRNESSAKASFLKKSPSPAASSPASAKSALLPSANSPMPRRWTTLTVPAPLGRNVRAMSSSI